MGVFLEFRFAFFTSRLASAQFFFRWVPLASGIRLGVSFLIEFSFCLRGGWGREFGGEQRAPLRKSWDPVPCLAEYGVVFSGAASPRRPISMAWPARLSLFLWPWGARALANAPAVATHRLRSRGCRLGSGWDRLRHPGVGGLSQESHKEGFSPNHQKRLGRMVCYALSSGDGMGMQGEWNGNGTRMGSVSCMAWEWVQHFSQTIKKAW